MPGEEKSAKQQGIIYNPWIQLFSGVMCMMMIANLQYGWTLFVNPISAKFGWERASIQVAFTIFIFLETWMTPIEAYFVDKYGPRTVVLCGSFLVGGSWVINAFASSLIVFYISSVMAACGAAAVYGTSVGNALKWFPYRRGLAAGITAAGFGAGAAITVVPISRMIAAGGYENAFLYFGIGQGLIIFAFSFLLRQAPKVKVVVRNAKRSARDFKPAEVLRSGMFWMIYPLFVCVAASGISFAAQIGPIAKDFGIDVTPVTLGGITLPALTFAIAINRILDGCGRPFFGFIADHIGREWDMFICFTLGAVFLFTVGHYGQNPVVFVVISGLYFGCFGEIYSNFPATAGDTFGGGFAASNSGMLYTAKGCAAIFVPIFAVVAAHWGWAMVFDISMTMNLLGAVYAVTILRPARRNFIAATHRAAAAAENAQSSTIPASGSVLAA
ncbi:MAG: oxalate/formate MFS antiporter [Azospirillaceae bacterium]|nr:oxalate/formate MFS antiporter [Azospirillaceae bacterium]